MTQLLYILMQQDLWTTYSTWFFWQCYQRSELSKPSINYFILSANLTRSIWDEGSNVECSRCLVNPTCLACKIIFLSLGPPSLNRAGAVAFLNSDWSKIMIIFIHCWPASSWSSCKWRIIWTHVKSSREVRIHILLFLSLLRDCLEIK